MYERDYDRNDYLIARKKFDELGITDDDSLAAMAKSETPPFDPGDFDPLALKKALIDTYNLDGKAGEQKLLGYGLPVHGKIEPGIYWCARDVNTWATQMFNHHFLLIVNNTDSKPPVSWYRGESWRTIQPEGHVMTTYITLGGFFSKEDDHKLVFKLNEDADVGSVTEHIAGKPWRWWRYLGFEKNPITDTPVPLQQVLLDLSSKYFGNPISNLPNYNMFNQNCSTWVNSVCHYSGVPESKRAELRKFEQIDWGEEVVLPAGLFGVDE